MEQQLFLILLEDQVRLQYFQQLLQQVEEVEQLVQEFQDLVLQEYLEVQEGVEVHLLEHLLIIDLEEQEIVRQ